MRRLPIATAMLLLIVLFSGCKKSSTSDPACNGLSDFTLAQQGGVLKFNLINGSASYYELCIQSPGSDPCTTSTSIVTSTSFALSIDSIHLLAGQTYAVYVRSGCSGSLTGAWVGPKIIALNDFCDKPYQLGVSAYPDGMGFDWQVKSGTNATSFQVQYGIKGFALGSGTTAIVNNSPYTSAAMMANTNYDFYVRSSCSGSLGFSDWAGPYSYFSSANQHLCTTPSNVIYTVVRNGLGQAVGANFQWDFNGETNFEYTFVRTFQTVNDGTIYSINNAGTPTILGIFQDTDYHFYVRAVCVDGSRTSWFGPVLFNIGH